MPGILQRFTASIAVFMWLLCAASAALAQNEAGRIAGKVTDAQGAAVPNAQIKVKSEDSGIMREAASDNEGFYLVPGLQPGVYEVTTQATGFAQRTQRVQVTVGASRRLETQLSVTPVTEEQEIVGGSGGVEINTQNAQLADPISGRQIRQLPTITRDPYDLITLSGNLTPVPDPNATNQERGPAYAINGQRPNTNNVLLDGGEHITNYGSSLGQRIPLDGVQEMQVITSGFRPEYGRLGGGLINVATRQGSNDWNGSLYWFHRNDEVSSNSFENNALGIPRGHLVANQFGYSVGGPIFRDRLFFFNSTEGNLVRSRENRVALVPTPELLAASSGATQTFFNTFPLGATTSGRIFTVADVRALTGANGTTGAFFGLPATSPAFRQVFFNVPVDIGAGAPQDTGSTVGRVDWALSERTLIYGRYAFEDRNLYRGAFSFSPFSGFNTGVRERNHSGLFNASHGYSNNWTVNAKGSFNRINLERSFGPGFNVAAPRLFLTNFASAGVGGFPITLPGDFPFNPGLNDIPTGPMNLLQGALDFAGPWRNQNFNFGVSYFYTQDNRNFNTLANSIAVLGGSLPSALNNLVTGNLSTFQVAFNPRGLTPGQTIALPVAQPNFNRSLSAHDFSAYFGHNVRALPRVNVFWGLRYDFFDTPRRRDGLPLVSFFAGEGADVFNSIQNGRLVTAGLGTADGTLYERDWDNIAPRIGLAWDITGDGKTALRGGYGLTYVRPFSTIAPFFQSTNAFAVASFTATGAGAPLSLGTGLFGPLGGAVGSTTVPAFAARGVSATLETPRIHFWNLSLEREIGLNTIVAAHYAGSHGEELYTIYNVNRPGSAAAFLGATDPLARLNPAFGPITYLTTDGRSNYNALLLEAANSTWRSIGVQMSARYRYAKALNNVNTFPSTGLTSFATNQFDPFNPNNDYGPADYDLRHRFIGSVNWEVPFDKIGDRFFGGAGTAVARQILGGWQLAGIFNVQSGLPFTVFNCAAAATAEAPCPRLAATGSLDRNGLEDPLPDPTIPNRFVYLNPTVGAVTPGTVFPPFAPGTTGRNFFRGPNFWNIDVGVHKRFAFTENTSIQFRGEFFNVFNNANLFVPQTVDISSNGYVPAFKSGRRFVQLGVKFLF